MDSGRLAPFGVRQLAATVLEHQLRVGNGRSQALERADHNAGVVDLRESSRIGNRRSRAEVEAGL